MKIMVYILSVMLILIGGIWVLQGINVLGGSSMTGQGEWIVYGAITIVAGVGLLAFNSRHDIFKR